MFNRILSLFLIGLILNTAFYSNAQAQTNSDKEAKRAAKVKSRVEKVKKAADKFDERVVVKLLDGTKIKGNISEIQDDSFVIVDEKTGKSTQISYLQVKKVRETISFTKEEIATIALGAFAIFNLIVSGRQ